jgi:hypothetical protein
MNVTFKTVRGPWNAKNYAGEKEICGMLRVVAYQDGAFCEPVRVVLYRGRSASATRVYCSVWVNAPGVDVSGRGHAGGGGYHKASAAMAAALDSAGIELDEAIDGRGGSAMREAAAAIARALGYKQIHLVEFGI